MAKSVCEALNGSEKNCTHPGKSAGYYCKKYDLHSVLLPEYEKLPASLS